MTATMQFLPDSRYTTSAMVRRLFVEQALTHWRLYAAAFVLMAIAAGCTATTAYLLGDFINQAYLHKNFHGILVLGGIVILVFAVRGGALYGQAVLLSRIGNRISAANQRRMFHKLLNEGLGYFVDRHSSEFTARLNAGATAATIVLNLLVTAAGLLVTKTHIVARHAHRPPFVRIGNKFPVFGKTFPGHGTFGRR